MDLSIQGSRPPSARSQSRINPITGEEMLYSARGTPRDQPMYRQQTPDIRDRPDGVPALNLGAFHGKDDEKDFTFAMDQYAKQIKTPNSASTVSWGTPTSAYNSSSQYSHKKQQQVQDLVSHRESGRGYSGRSQRSLREGDQESYRSARQPPTPKQPSAWDREPVPENLPPPSQRYKQQYRQHEQEVKQAYKKKSQLVDEEGIGGQIEKLKLDLPLCPSGEDETDDQRDQLQKGWTNQPYSKAALRKKGDLEHLEEEKKKNKLIETVMIDQLSRAVIACPEQTQILSQAKPQPYRPGMKRGTVRTMHDTKVRTAGTSTENLLSKRVRFSARVLSRSGRDAIRELTGFFFAIDNSLTIYEFRQFGKSAKALPFIKRGTYEKQSGKHSGELFQLVDIVQGGELEFLTSDQPLPESIKQASSMKLKITEVDDDTKAAILLDGVNRSERETTWKQLHLPTSREELQSRVLMQRVQGTAALPILGANVWHSVRGHDRTSKSLRLLFVARERNQLKGSVKLHSLPLFEDHVNHIEMVRKQISRRGIKVFTGLGRELRKATRDEGGANLNKYELEKALCDFHIDVPNEMFDDLWEYLDADGTSFLSHVDFLRGYLGEMTESRKALVRKAFRKVDSGKHGVVTVDEMKKFYNAHNHPKVKSGECSESEVLHMFISNFLDTCTKGEVTYEEFAEYYEGLSVCIENDEDFENILKNAWSI